MGNTLEMSGREDSPSAMLLLVGGKSVHQEVVHWIKHHRDQKEAQRRISARV